MADPRSVLPTHEVLNQPAPRGDLDLWSSDLALREAATRGEAREEALASYGVALGRADTREAARQANRQTPELKLFDSGGRRLDEVTFHPAYHQLMSMGIGAGYPSIAWEGGAGGHVTHAAMVYLAS